MEGVPNINVRGSVQDHQNFENKHRLQIFFDLVIHFNSSVTFIWLLATVLIQAFFYSQTVSSYSQFIIISLLLLTGLKFLGNIYYRAKKSERNAELLRLKTLAETGTTIAVFVIFLIGEIIILTTRRPIYDPNGVEEFFVTAFRIWHYFFLGSLFVYTVIEFIRYMILLKEANESHAQFDLDQTQQQRPIQDKGMVDLQVQLQTQNRGQTAISQAPVANPFSIQNANQPSQTQNPNARQLQSPSQFDYPGQQQASASQFQSPIQFGQNIASILRQESSSGYQYR